MSRDSLGSAPRPWPRPVPFAPGAYHVRSSQRFDCLQVALTGRAPHPAQPRGSTGPCRDLTRWITKGVRKADGTRIKLEARRFPGGWRVADEAVDRFVDELTGAALGDAESAGTSTFETSSSRKRELARVDAELASAGF